MNIRKQPLVRWLPLIILLIALGCVLYLRLYTYISLSQLKVYHQSLIEWTNNHYLISILLYLLIYIFAVAIAFPATLILSIVGGLLFGIIQGSFYVLIAASFGACILFLSVKTSLGHFFAEKHFRWLNKFEKGFHKNAFSYILVLRLIPIFPFWAINIAAGLLNVRLRIFFLATLLGIIPGALIYVSLGHGLTELLNSKQESFLLIINSPRIILPLIGLAILALLPILYKRIKGK